ncbi:MAG TPA: hypothetical protein VGC32_04850 [Solirubrobacterales bacterium]
MSRQAGRAAEIAELRRAVEAVETLAATLAEALGVGPQSGVAEEERPAELLSAAEVARLWGVARRWVYEHADELGAERLGEGVRPRLGFEAGRIRDRLGAPLARRRGPGQGRLETPPGGDDRDSLQRPGRATFTGPEHVAGRRTGVPGPAPEEAPSAR